MFNYIERKKYAYDWSILIPTMVGREKSLQNLLQSINEKRERLCPNLKIEISISFDNKEASIGTKRQQLLRDARGKYMSFIDDDDDITDAYFEDARECIVGKYHVCRLRGQIRQYTFTHSTEYDENSMLAVGDVFTRPPNHLNIMLTEPAKFVDFKDLKNAEDFDWAIKLSKYKFFTLEYQPDLSRIHYIYNVSYEIQDQMIERQRNRPVISMLRFTQPFVVPTPPSTNSRVNGMRFTSRGFVSK
jgi:hypothetical protein